MAVELECKLPVPSHDAVRGLLRAASAQPRGAVVETNYLLDDARRSLFERGCALRVRSLRPADPNTASGPATLTFKGLVQKSAFKQREEVELEIVDADAMLRLLAALGYSPWLVFEKRRESWTLDACKIELDQLPRLGCFIEIEAPSEPAIRDALALLKLDAAGSITRAYPALIAEHLGSPSRVACGDLDAPRPLTLCFS